MKTAIHTRDAPEAIGTYSQAIRAGDTVYLSGQIGLDPATMQLAEGIEGQTHRVFRNLAALASAAPSRVDFVLHLPLRYEDETALFAPAEAPAGRAVSVEANVESAKIEYRPRRQLIVRAKGLVLRFFNFYPSQLKQFQRAADESLKV